jgi:5'-phosphate synthase pdxT subunit
LKKVGILAIQGDFEKHKQIIEKIGHTSIDVRTSYELTDTDALIIPGGESTTILKLIYQSDLKNTLVNYARTHPIMGTCAGLILLANDVDELPEYSLKLIDIGVKRNAYGRQRESFVDTVSINLNGTSHSDFPGVFIRAPKITKLGENIRVLGWHKGEAVMVSNSNILVCTFHPELTEDARIHTYFLENFLK